MCPFATSHLIPALGRWKRVVRNCLGFIVVIHHFLLSGGSSLITLSITYITVVWYTGLLRNRHSKIFDQFQFYWGSSHQVYLLSSSIRKVLHPCMYKFALSSDQWKINSNNKTNKIEAFKLDTNTSNNVNLVFYAEYLKYYAYILRFVIFFAE